MSLRSSGWLLLSLAGCATAPVAPPPSLVAVVLHHVEAPPPALCCLAAAETPPRVAPATAAASRLLPGFCRQRRVDGFGTAPEVTLSRARWDGDRLREIEVATATGDDLYRMMPKLDAAGRVVELTLLESDNRPAGKRLFRYDVAGRLVEESWLGKGERRPRFARAASYDAAGTLSAETWSFGDITWRLAPRFEGNQVIALVRDDGRIVVRYVRDAQGNVLLESRTEPDGKEVRLVSDLACFGTDETALTVLAEQCEDGDGRACGEVARLLSQEGYPLGFAPDPALAAAYDRRACALGNTASCQTVAAQE